MRDELRRRGLVDASGKLAGATGGQAPPASDPTVAERVRTANRLWAQARPLASDPAAAYCARRGVRPPWPEALRHHPAVPAGVYRDQGPVRSALLGAIHDGAGRLCGVEITYLTVDGRRANLRIPRKVVGLIPAGSAIRLAPPAAAFCVGEGVFTTLAAMARFARPGWALLSTSNLRRWSPPPGVRDVLVAGDRGPDGERSAELLARRLRDLGLTALVRFPPPRFGDWDELRAAEAGRGGLMRDDPSGL